MDAAEIAETKKGLGFVYNQRYEVEAAERWRDISKEMPHLKFLPSWGVAIIPPFAGAVARFVVKKGKASVSVYADYYERLGCWAEPHWEIYPGPSGENERFSIATETDAMMAAIKKSLAKQGRERARV